MSAENAGSGSEAVSPVSGAEASGKPLPSGAVPGSAVPPAPGVAVPEVAVPEVAVPEVAVPEEAEMRKALSAFRKRMKALQLETDSKLGRQHVTGKKETITEIQPPLGFGKEIWEHLARVGWLKYEGRGFYRLIKKD